MLKFEFFEPKFGTWAPYIKPFFDSGGMDKIYKKLKERSNDGIHIFPAKEDTFRCFVETPIDTVKVVMMGMCPYHSIRDKQIVADGLLMGCSKTMHCQPSLVKFYEGLEEELFNGMNLCAVMNPDVTYLCKQGVLMFNAALTVESGKAGSHNELWKPFTRFIFEEIISKRGWPIIFLGKEAAHFSRYTAPMQWWFELYHPAYAEYRKEKWETKGVFGKVNKILEDNLEEPIKWLEELPF